MNRKGTKRVLIADNAINKLRKKPEGTVTEAELKEALRRYNLCDGLINLGQLSIKVFNDNSKNRISKTAVREPTTGIFITQFALAYLANILIISGANDFKSKHIGNKDNWLALLNIYSNGLVFLEMKSNDKIQFTDKDMASLFVRMSSEQLEYQFDHVHIISRTLIIFTKIVKEVIPDKFDELEVIFKKENGLTFEEYFALAMAVLAASQKTPTFRKEVLTKAKIPSIQEVLTDSKVGSFLDMLAIDYKRFRQEDKAANVNLQPIFTKTRFNPLIFYPIIKTDKKMTDPYVIPNTIAYLRRAYGGLYWWFHRYFEAIGMQLDFRNYYGKVFENYVGHMLKSIYGGNNVHPEIIYPQGKFIDWWVENNSTIYLFEAKAYQFALPTKQTGDIKLLENEVKSKIIKAIKQVYKRVLDIDQYNELAIFRNKKIIPIVVFMEIPLVSAHLYKKLLDEELQKLEDDGLVNIKNQKIHFINIEELELYGEAVHKILIEDVFAKYENDIKEGFLSIVQKELGRPPRNEYLGRVYNDFWTKATGRNATN